MVQASLTGETLDFLSNSRNTSCWVAGMEQDTQAPCPYLGTSLSQKIIQKKGLMEKDVHCSIINPDLQK